MFQNPSLRVIDIHVVLRAREGRADCRFKTLHCGSLIFTTPRDFAWSSWRCFKTLHCGSFIFTHPWLFCPAGLLCFKTLHCGSFIFTRSRWYREAELPTFQNPSLRVIDIHSAALGFI